MFPRLVLLAAGLIPALAGASAPGQHPQAVTDCSNCHLDRSTGMPDLQALHDFRCDLCHVDFNFSGTFLGPLGTWNRECSACHNEAEVRTGNLLEPAKGHRCVVCHGQQMPLGNVRDMHEEHSEIVNCVVCHGFVADVGTAIGSGNRNGCTLCHEGSRLQAGLQRIHREMTEEGLSCLECHGGTRPPVDVLPGPPVGNATTVCDVCHTGANPAVFQTRGPELHRKHTDEMLDCGSCHADANLQDDREVMPPVDDSRRAMLNRSGFNECAHCHSGGRSAAPTTVHAAHVADQHQWCYNCHEGMDPRPLGQTPPVTTPSESCALCHGTRQYTDAFPFDVHEEHAEDLKCYSCHQARPPLTDWPERWMRPRGVFATYGNACTGSVGAPTIGHTGSPGLGNTFQVTLAGAPSSTPALLALGHRGQVLDLTPLGMPGCTALVEPLGAALAITTPGGSASFHQTVPNEPRLQGVAFYFQWFALDPPANVLGLIASDGLRTTIGR